MKVDLFDFDLPTELIAQIPVEPRDASRLLVYERAGERVEHRFFKDLDQLLTPDDVLVFNQTKVEPRRLLGVKEDTGGKVEILLLDKITLPGSSLIKQEKASEVWECKVSPGLKIGQQVNMQRQKKTDADLQAEVVDITEEGNRLIMFNKCVPAVWQDYGVLPIPPYIHDYQGDEQLYQTIYAREEGSVAAPTAGRHFTKELLTRLEEKGVQMEYLTLHVSRDTAFPIIKEQDVENVRVHSEWVDVLEDVAIRLNKAKQAGKRIIAVGTTSVRTLEGIATISSGKIRPYQGQIDLFISPGYMFKFVDSMITNFHFPRSSLLMLVAAFVGRQEILDVYEQAVNLKYRFFSFGDAMFLTWS